MYTCSSRTPPSGEMISIIYKKENINESTYEPYYKVFCRCDNCRLSFNPTLCYHFDFLLTLMCADKKLKAEPKSETLYVPKTAFGWFIRQLLERKIKYMYVTNIIEENNQA
jgi:hypothetical protein